MPDLAETVPQVRRANKAQAAQFFDITLPTLEKWIREGAPVVQRGARGVSWVLDLRQVAEWKYGGWQNEDGEINPEALQPADRKAWYDGEKTRRSIQVDDRELIPASEVERVLATSFAAIAQGLRGMPDNIERRTGCAIEIVELLVTAIDAEMDALADRLAALAPVEEAAE